MKTRAHLGVLRAEGAEVIHTSIRAPKTNATAERWIGTARRECLDRILMLSRRHLESTLGAFTDHYNGHRPHRAFDMGCASTQTTRSCGRQRSAGG